MIANQGDIFLGAFAPLGTYYTIGATASAANTTVRAAQNHIIYNAGTVDIVVSYSGVATVATAGNTGNGFVIGAGTTQSLTPPPGTVTVSVITVSSTATVYLTLGQGQ